MFIQKIKKKVKSQFINLFMLADPEKSNNLHYSRL